MMSGSVAGHDRYSMLMLASVGGVLEAMPEWLIPLWLSDDGVDPAGSWLPCGEWPIRLAMPASWSSEVPSVKE